MEKLKKIAFHAIKFNFINIILAILAIVFFFKSTTLTIAIIAIVGLGFNIYRVYDTYCVERINNQYDIL